MNKPSRNYVSIPLNFILVVPFILEIFLAVGITGFLSLRNGEKAVQQLVNQLQEEIGNRIDQRIESYLDVSWQINDLNAEAIRLGELNPDNPEQLRRHFWQQMRVFPSLAYIYFGHEQRGGFVGVGISENSFGIRRVV